LLRLAVKRRQPNKAAIIHIPGHIGTMDTGTHDGTPGNAGIRKVVINGERLNSKDLFADQRELLIVHGDDTYRLRLTFQNKLILTK
jgi:hemin uptake protein HemP